MAALDHIDTSKQARQITCVNVSVTQPFEEFIRRKVEAGAFASAEEVVQAGLRLLEERDLWASEAHRKIEEGWQQAAGHELLSPEEVRQDLAARKAEWKRERLGK